MNGSNSFIRLRCVLFVTVVVLFTAYSMAGTITVFSGQDDGASTTGPWPNSAAAESAFMAAIGSSNLLTFESLPLGYYTPVNGPGVSIDLSSPNYGDGYSGISVTTYGNLYGFNTTAGGAQWLGFPGGTGGFSFSASQNYFGIWLTGVQTVWTSSFTLYFSDDGGHTLTTLNLPINVNGGTAYFGFTDTATFPEVWITNLSNDAWGVDDLRYRATPEPSSLLLIGSGLLGLAANIRRKLLQ